MIVHKAVLLVNHIERDISINQEINSLPISIGPFENENVFSISLKFYFSEVPVAFRNHDYTWCKCNTLCISNPVSPKILKFRGDTYLMADRYVGTWIYNPEHPKILEWRLWGPELSPVYHFDDNRLRHWYKPQYYSNKPLEIGLIITETPVEISRSLLPFSAVVVFTDHCDFDSAESLSAQREFFKNRNIKVTKGYFTRHYSRKGDWNASLEKNRKEYEKWVHDGHELAYHSLSQSILPFTEDHETVFNSFASPSFANVATWIDHGYQPYNWSLQDTRELKVLFQQHMLEKKVRLVWNYYDASEASWNLNQNNFRISDFKNIIFSKLSLFDKIRILLFYNGSDEFLVKYRKIAPLIKEGHILKAFTALSEINFQLSLEDYIKRVQLFFSVDSEDITFFQTIAVKDWSIGLGKPLDNLIKERGVAVIHSYFSFTGSHHNNPLFLQNSVSLNKKAELAFDRLSGHIKSGNIWNPTLVEFYNHVKIIQSVVFNYCGNTVTPNDNHLLRKSLIRYIK